jgi:hypothetical protein
MFINKILRHHVYDKQISKQSKAKQSKAKQSKAKQSKAKQSKPASQPVTKVTV